MGRGEIIKNMREFKFRAWYHQQKKFDYGGFEMFSHFSFPLYWCEIQQFTGLKDSEGNGIYEGDILKYSYFDPYEIRGEDGKFLKWSKDKKEFYRTFEIVWHHGTVDVNFEYDCLYNGFAAKLVATNTPYDEEYLNKIFPIANKNADKSPIGFSAEGIIADNYSVVGNVFQDPELLEN